MLSLIILGLVIAVISLILLIIGAIFCLSRRVGNAIQRSNNEKLETTISSVPY